MEQAGNYHSVVIKFLKPHFLSLHPVFFPWGFFLGTVLYFFSDIRVSAPCSPYVHALISLGWQFWQKWMFQWHCSARPCLPLCLTRVTWKQRAEAEPDGKLLQELSALQERSARAVWLWYKFQGGKEVVGGEVGHIWGQAAVPALWCVSLAFSLSACLHLQRVGVELIL